MKTLIIAEKSSLAKSIVDGIKLIEPDVKTNKTPNGIYFESTSYIVVAARGHLYKLFDIDDYAGHKVAWTMGDLPYFPSKFLFKPIEDAENYILNIKELLNRADVNTVVNAGDSGREGEILIRIILNELNCKHPVFRLWLPSQVSSEVKEGLLNMESDSKKDNLYNEGMARMYSDWLDGINLTRLASLLSGSFIRVGRVYTTILGLIYDRDMSILNFKSEDYYKLESITTVYGSKLKLVSDEEFEPEEYKDAEKLAIYLNSKLAIVSDIDTKDIIEVSPKLFSQATLQNYMSQKYSFTPDKTLSISQELYENKYISYPRVDSEYLATSEIEKNERLLGRLQKNGLNVILKTNSRIFDDSKIEEHSALTPTILIPDMDKLTEDQKKVYNAILNRYCSVFCKEDRVIAETILAINIADYETVELKGKVVKAKGWRIFEDTEDEDILLPNLKVGDTFKVDFKPVKKSTKPLNHYSVTTLNNFLKSPLRKNSGKIETDIELSEEDYKNFAQGMTIGTAASTPGILKKLCDDELVKIKGKNYIILEKGMYVVETLRKLNIKIDVDKTIVMNQYLKKVNSGEMKIDEYLKVVEKELAECINDANGKEIDSYDSRVIVGKCPRCKSDIIEAKKNFYCENKNCKFVLFKEDKFWTSKHKRLSGEMAKKLLEGKYIKMKGLYSEKTTKEYDAYVCMEDDGERTTYKMKF